jgi:hypothetical protein
MLSNLDFGDVVVLSVLVFGCLGFFVDLVTCAILHRALLGIGDRDLALPRASVWLPSIPCVGFVFHFYVLPRVVDSLAPGSNVAAAKTARSAGVWYAIARTGTLIPCLDFLAAPAALILIGVFLLHLAELSRARRPER